MRIPTLAAAALIAAVGLLAWPGTAPAGDARAAADTYRVASTQPQALAPAPAAAGAPVIEVRAVPRARASTGWAALDRAIARIPYYYPGVARWHAVDRGAWGVTALNTGDIYIAPRTPADKLASVVTHEWAHALTGRLYGGFDATAAAANRHFAQNGVPAFEVEADCMALVGGATWTWYSSCPDARRRADALRLLQGQPLT